jgi:hypothetical protein
MLCNHFCFIILFASEHPAFPIKPVRLRRSVREVLNRAAIAREQCR